MTSTDVESTSQTGALASTLSFVERLPKPAVFLGVLAVAVGVLMTPGTIGAVLTLLLACAAGALAWATWSRGGAAAARLARVATVFALTALGVAKLVF